MEAKDVIETAMQIIRGQMTITVEEPVYEYRLVEATTREEIVEESTTCNYLGTVLNRNGQKFYCVSRKLGGITEAAFDGALETLFFVLVKDSSIFDMCKTKEQKERLIEGLTRMVDIHIRPYLTVNSEMRIRRREEVNAIYHALELRIQKIKSE